MGTEGDSSAGDSGVEKVARLRVGSEAESVADEATLLCAAAVIEGAKCTVEHRGWYSRSIRVAPTDLP